MRTLNATIMTVALLAGPATAVAAQEDGQPTTTDELLAGMVTEEVEPGVIRVVNDGYRDLWYANGYLAGYTVDITPDGSVWLSGDEGRQGLFRLGEEAVFEYFEYPASWPPYLEAAPGGSLWALGKDPDWSDSIFSFDGEGWTERATTTDDTLLFRALTIGPDGTVWVAASDRDQSCPDTANCIGTVLLRLEEDGSLTAIEDWADVYDRDVSPDEVAVSPDGDVWLIGQGRSYPHGGEVLLRFDGERWEAIPGPEGWLPGTLGRSLDFDPEGALWVKANETGGLARFDDPDWTVFTEADGIEPWGGLGWFYMDLLTAAPDGSFWLNGRPTAGGCGGLAHWDGTTSTSYLGDSCINDLAIAADGSAWLRADAGDRVNTYVIRPEGGATTE